ncbi:MAG: MiaB/RimO family radical SAM methylthiotransferase [Candidatus Dormibacteraeota bacterium]|uniref:tRNA-2-methylthio-N(6)-dimethylallyladenosine synthase n=1 Tax=Candidatus Amunia macphersoniae TaxID=3127014 RepID=A0A934KL31_9BACT|nr:MiaB/RimO family radical SAM methylthiotransferase [Candidatus Dormibacteraeota bacterium]
MGREPIVPRLGRPPRVHLWHIGCQMNDADHLQLAECFAEIGFIPDVALEDADIAVLISCAVRSNAEQKVYGKFKELIPWKKARPGRAIALTGCMAVEHGSALLQRMADLDYMFDVREPEGFFARLQSLHGGDVDGPVTMPASDRLLAYVPVMGGCNEMCTYCIVPFVRGRESSRSTAEIVGDVRRLVDRGVREITLLGQNVNSYRDPQTNTGLPELLAAVDAVPGLWRLRFLTSHPRNAVPQLFEAMRDLPTVCEQLHLPVQAGDDELLRRMRRVYSVAEYREKIAVARATVPDLALTTDIIVGFSGETEAEFEGTVQLLRDVEYDVVHIQAYSVRPGTAAARRPDDVPLAEKKRRLNHLLQIQRGIAGNRNRALLDRRVEVLVEGVAVDGRAYGRTRQGKVAWLPAGSARAGEMHVGRVAAANHWQLDLDTVSSAA